MNFFACLDVYHSVKLWLYLRILDKFRDSWSYTNDNLMKAIERWDSMNHEQIVIFVEISLDRSNPLLPNPGLEALKAAGKLEFGKIVLARNPKSYEAVHEYADEWIACDTTNVNDVVEIAQKYHVSALLSFSDVFTGIANQAANLLGLKSVTDRYAPAISTNKADLRTVLEAFNIPHIHWTSRSLNDSLSTSSIGYPCIIRSAEGSASVEARRVENNHQLNKVLSLYRSYQTEFKNRQEVLFEEEPQGPLYSIEGFVDGKNVEIWGYFDCLLLSQSCFCEAKKTFFTAAPNHSLPDFCKSVLNASGYDFGPFHITFVLTEDGPKLIDLNPGLIGSGAHRCMNYACETNIAEHILNRYLNRQYEKIERKKFSTLLNIFPKKTGVFQKINNLESGFKISGLKEIVTTKNTGDPVSRPKSNSDQLGYLISIGNSYNYSLGTAKKALNKLIIEISESYDR